jgi:hypothetical protein
MPGHSFAGDKTQPTHHRSSVMKPKTHLWNRGGMGLEMFSPTHAKETLQLRAAFCGREGHFREAPR